MTVIRHAAGAVKMRIYTAHRSKLLIFHVVEVVERASSDINADLCRNVVRGLQHHAVEHVAKRKRLTDPRVKI